MHPVVIIVPVAALAFGPRLWVGRLLKQHNRMEEQDFPTGGELARELLDRHHLGHVRVECTDIGDHYDPLMKAVRLTRDKFDRRTLAAVTTAAHEVAHAIQDASDYGPFVLRARLASAARIILPAGTAILVAVPAASLATHRPISPVFLGAALFSMLGTGIAVQLATLPTELDASFGRAMPMLRDGYVNASQAEDARLILLASSLTYIASSLLAVLHVWPWIGRPVPGFLPASATTPCATAGSGDPTSQHRGTRPRRVPARRAGLRGGAFEQVLRCVGKPLIRGWLRISHAR